MKLSVIEKILIVVTVAILIGVFSNKHSSPPANNPPQIKQVENPKVADLGLTVSEFRQAYEEWVTSYSVPSLRIRGAYSSTKDGKYSTYLHTSDTIFLELEMDNEKTWIQRVTVACEPSKILDEKSVIERAGIAYIFVIEILTPELTSEEHDNIVHKLSSNLKNYSVVEGDIRYKTRFYNGFLMLSAEPN